MTEVKEMREKINAIKTGGTFRRKDITPGSSSKVYCNMVANMVRKGCIERIGHGEYRKLYNLYVPSKKQGSKLFYVYRGEIFTKMSVMLKKYKITQSQYNNAVWKGILRGYLVFATNSKENAEYYLNNFSHEKVEWGC